MINKADKNQARLKRHGADLEKQRGADHAKIAHCVLSHLNAF